MIQDQFITIRVCAVLKNLIEYVAQKNDVTTSYLMKDILTFFVEDVMSYMQEHDGKAEGYIQNLEEVVNLMHTNN